MALQQYDNFGVIVDKWPKDSNTSSIIYQNANPTRYTAVFAVDGTISIGTGHLRIYNITGASRTITKVEIAVDTAPTGTAVIIDVNVNGTTIFTTQANRPQIAVGSNFGSTTSIDQNVFADGDYLQADIDQIGSGAAYLTIHVTYF